MHTKLSVSYLAALTCMVCATNAHAQYYGGVSLGATRTVSGQLSAGRVNSIGNFANFGADSDSFTPTEQLTIMPAAGLQLANEPSLGIKLGYRFNPYFAVESRYVTANLSTTGPSLFSREATNITRREQSVGLDLVGNVSLMKKLSLQGRAGLRSELSALAFINTNVGNLAPAAAGVMGLSLNYNFNSSIGLRFEVERSRKFFNDRFAGDADSAVSFGLLWRF
jgi:Outer membrane protein beta-barrel domain